MDYIEQCNWCKKMQLEKINYELGKGCIIRSGCCCIAKSTYVSGVVNGQQIDPHVIKFYRCDMHCICPNDDVKKLTFEWQNILKEIKEMSDIPPGVDKRHIFRNGGFGFHESWNEIK